MLKSCKKNPPVGGFFFSIWGAFLYLLILTPIPGRGVFFYGRDSFVLVTRFDYMERQIMI